MNAKLLNGRELSQEILLKLTDEVALLAKNNERQPALAVVLVGNNPASKVYVNSKKNACIKVGVKSLEYLLPETVSEQQLLDLIIKLNQDNQVDGILVQLPLPAHLNSKLIIDTILPNKDVDGFHRYNMGSLALKDPSICPCTPHGVMYMLDSINYKYLGKHAIIIGASNIVGRPMALELLNRGATVTICNSKTTNLPELLKLADIVVAAVGKPKFVQGAWIKPDSVVIDVGINHLSDGSLCGDVDFDAVQGVAAYLTPVPGGVGPMTIAMLIKNTLSCYYAQNSKKFK
jgi:methylenetetrahydrofolate dehydrogenase (NADP+) / methenyltetrahydrofolate cyclohydrolase